MSNKTPVLKIVHKSKANVGRDDNDVWSKHRECDNCGKTFLYDSADCCNRMVMPPIKEILKDPYNAHETYKYWCAKCTTDLNLNPT